VRAARTHRVNATTAIRATTTIATHARPRMDACGLAATAITLTHLAQHQAAQTRRVSALLRAVATTMTATRAPGLMGASGRVRTATALPHRAVGLDVRTPRVSAAVGAAAAALVPATAIVARGCIATAVPSVAEAVRCASRIPAGKGPVGRAPTAIAITTLLMVGARKNTGCFVALFDANLLSHGEDWPCTYAKFWPTIHVSTRPRRESQ